MLGTLTCPPPGISITAGCVTSFIGLGVSKMVGPPSGVVYLFSYLLRKSSSKTFVSAGTTGSAFGGGGSATFAAGGVYLPPVALVTASAISSCVGVLKSGEITLFFKSFNTVLSSF